MQATPKLSPRSTRLETENPPSCRKEKRDTKRIEQMAVAGSQGEKRAGVGFSKARPQGGENERLFPLKSALGGGEGKRMDRHLRARGLS